MAYLIYFIISAVLVICGLTLTAAGVVGIIKCISYKKKKGENYRPAFRVLPIAAFVVGLIIFINRTTFLMPYIVSYVEDQKYDKSMQSYYMSLQGEVEKGDYAKVSKLLRSGINPDECYKAGDTFTPLMIASSQKKDYKDTELLIQYHADVNAVYTNGDAGFEKGYTPLFFSIMNEGNDKTIKLLLDHGADVNHKAADGSTVLKEACIYQWHSPAIIQMLIAAGTDVNAVDNDDNSVLYYACDPPDPDGNYHNYPLYSIVDMLLKKGADAKFRTKEGQSLIDLVELNRKSEKAASTDDFNFDKGISGPEDNYSKIEELLRKYGAK